MDDLFKISSILEKEPDNLENFDELKKLLNEVQEQIESEKISKESKIMSKIEKLEELKKQINNEIILNNNNYNSKSDEYKFPDKLKNYNIFLRERIEQLNNNKSILNKNKKKLALLVAKKNEYISELNLNLNIIDDKKKKINNSLEITALIEKKKSLIGNKRKNNCKYQKMIEVETKKYQNYTDNLNKQIRLKNTETERKSNEINKLLEKSITQIKKLSIDSVEYGIKKKEILSLNLRLDKIQKNNTLDLKNINKNLNGEQINLENKRKEINEENREENEKIDQIISLIDLKYEELSNYFNLKKKEIVNLKKKINECVGEEKSLELKIFSINNISIENDIQKYKKKIEKEQNKAAQVFLSYKNIQDNICDELKSKIFKIEKKISILKNELKEPKFLEELNNRKKYIIELLNG